MSAHNVGLILLAAGASSRLLQGESDGSTPKQLLPWTNGRSLLRHAAETALASCCRPVVVVLGARAEQMENELRSNLPDVHIAHNPDWANGMGTSIRAGLRCLLAAVAAPDAAVVTLCDQPLVTPALINDLVDAHYASGKRIVAAEYDGIRGVPALFGRAVFDQLEQLDAAHGAKQLIARHGAEAVHAVAFPGGVVDIDTSDDYARFQARQRHA